MISHHVCLLVYHTVCLPLLNVTHSGNRSSKTFKPKKNIPEGSHQYELLKHAEATLGSGNLRMAVMLPEGEDLNEWVAVNSKHSHLLFYLHCALLGFRFLKELHYLNLCFFSFFFLMSLPGLYICIFPVRLVPEMSISPHHESADSQSFRV